MSGVPQRAPRAARIGSEPGRPRIGIHFALPVMLQQQPGWGNVAQTNESEVHALLKAADRDLADAAVDTISNDRRFATACSAAREIAAAVAAAGTVRSTPADLDGLHELPVLVAALGPCAGSRIRYLERCQARCERINHEAGLVSCIEVKELTAEVGAIRNEVRRWLEG